MADTGTRERTTGRPAVPARDGAAPGQSGGGLRRVGQSAVLPLLLLVAVLGVWEYLPPALGVQPFIIPRFSEVVEKFTTMETLSRIAADAWVTIYEALLGLLIGSALGVLCGLLLGDSPFLRRLFYPYVIGLQSLPKVAVAPLFVIWFGFGLAPKVLIVVVLTFFPLLVNTMSGVMNVDPDQRDLFRSICANPRQVWLRLLLPASLPAIFAGLEVAVVLSLLGAIVAEFVSAEAGLGVLLQQQQVMYDTAGMFAVLIVLSVVGVLFNKAVVFARRRTLFWAGPANN